MKYATYTSVKGGMTTRVFDGADTFYATGGELFTRATIVFRAVDQASAESFGAHLVSTARNLQIIIRSANKSKGR